MKYIVVYIILILGVSTMETEAQKTSIDLLPSAGASMRPQAMIDTCVIPDSMFLTDSIASLPEAEENSPALSRRSTLALTLLKPGLFTLFTKKYNPIHFIIHFTALKF